MDVDGEKKVRSSGQKKVKDTEKRRGTPKASRSRSTRRTKTTVQPPSGDTIPTLSPQIPCDECSTLTTCRLARDWVFGGPWSECLECYSKGRHCSFLRRSNLRHLETADKLELIKRVIEKQQATITKLEHDFAAAQALKVELKTEVQHLKELIEQERDGRAEALIVQGKTMRLAHAFGHYLLQSNRRIAMDSSILPEELSTTFSNLLI